MGGVGGVAWPDSLLAPAGDGAIAPHPTGVVPSGADGDEGTRGRPGLAASIRCPSRRRSHCSSLRRCVPPPALTETKEPAGGVVLDRVRIHVPGPSRRRSRCSSPRRCVPNLGADGDEGTRGRRGLAACNRCPSTRRSRCSLSRRCGFNSGTDGDEGTRGRRGLSVVCAVQVIAAPAGDGAVAPYPTGVERNPALTETKEPVGRPGLAASISAPAGRRSHCSSGPQVCAAPAADG